MNHIVCFKKYAITLGDGNFKIFIPNLLRKLPEFQKANLQF